MNSKRKSASETNLHKKTAVHAYYLWQQAGCPEGHDEVFWYQAETDLEIEARESASTPAWEKLPKFHVAG